MAEYVVAHLAEIDEISDGRCPFRPIRHHLGITSFAVNAWTGRQPGDRIINEHDEAGEHEELYVVHSGRATFELDGERVDAPAGTLVYARPGVRRTAYAEEADTTILAVGGAPGRVYEPDGWEIWAPFNRLYREGAMPRRPTALAKRSRRIPVTRGCSTTSRAAKASPADPRTRSST